MTKTATVQARIEPGLKNEAESVIGKLGLTASQVVSALYAQIVMNKGIPFELKIPNKLTRKTLVKSQKGKEVARFKNIADLMKDLDD